LPLEHYSVDAFRLKSEDGRLNGAFMRFAVRDGLVRQFQLLGLTFSKKKS
jgi:hypothetical protein